MSSSSDPPPPAPLSPQPALLPFAWQPFTFRGVAAFAQAPVFRLFLLQFAVAALSATSIVWFLAHCYCPVLTQALEKLPAAAGVTNGSLYGFPEVLNSETKFLSIAIAQQDAADVGQIADLQITLHSGHLAISSLLSSALGSLDFAYDKSTPLDLSRSHLEPLWGAWEQAALAVIGIAVVIHLLLLWLILAVLYTPAAKFVAWFCDRQLSWTGAWRLAAAALLPGAILLALGILLYGWQRVDVFGLALLFILHILAGWTYLLAAPVFTPRQSPNPTQPNPFHAASPPQSEA